MAALLPVPNVVKINVNWKIGTDTAAITHFYWAWTGTSPSSATCILLAQATNSYINTQFLPVMNANVSLESTTVTDLTSSSGGQGNAPDLIAGTRTGSELPAATCALINGLIARRYRGGKPRFYLPWGSSTDVLTGQTWTAAALTAFQAAINNFVSSMNGNTQAGCSLAHPVNISYFSGITQYQNPVTLRWYNVPKPRSAPLVDPILSFPVNPKFGSQRRRNLHSA